MNAIIETSFKTLSLVAVVSFILFLLFKIYVIKRYGFFVSVNCWFCNNWTKVLYGDRNSFNCPACSQYNGFDDDGAYNKVIQAQHITSLDNKYNYKTNSKTEFSTNGLCTLCNNNQRLKVNQLANFVPLNEDNYDVEIEHFQKQLEKSYKLCKKCDRVLKTAIGKQHAWMFAMGGKSPLLKTKHKSLKTPSKSTDLKNKTIQILSNFFIKFLNRLIFISGLTVFLLTTNTQVEYLKRLNYYFPKELPDLLNKTWTDKVNTYNFSLFQNSPFKNFWDKKQFEYFESNNLLLPIACLGFVLEVIAILLMVLERKDVADITLKMTLQKWFWIVIKRCLPWVFLGATCFCNVVQIQRVFKIKKISKVGVDWMYFYCNLLQIIFTLTILINQNLTLPFTNKISLKLDMKEKLKTNNIKIKQKLHNFDFSDCEEEINEEIVKKSSKSRRNVHQKSPQMKKIISHFPQPIPINNHRLILENSSFRPMRNHFDDDLSFKTSTGKSNTTGFFSNSFSTPFNNCDSDETGSVRTEDCLHRSFDNLHLGGLNFNISSGNGIFPNNFANNSFCRSPTASPVFSVSSLNANRSAFILTPPKLRNVTQNPWTAGGVWQDNPAQDFNFKLSHSRSSSQSSGFISIPDYHGRGSLFSSGGGYVTQGFT